MLVLWKLILLSSVGIFGLSGNLLAVVTLVKNPNVMGESQKFILNQSVIDALTAVMLFLSDINIRAAGIVIHYQDNWAYTILCKTWSTGGLLWGFMTASTYSLVVLTLDRFLKIMHPFWSRKHYTRGLVNVLLVLPWIFGPVFQIGMQANASKIIQGECVMTMVFDTLGKITALVICTVEFYFPMLVILCFYCRIIVKLKRRNASMGKYRADQSSVTATQIETKASVVSEENSTSMSTLPEKASESSGDIIRETVSTVSIEAAKVTPTANQNISPKQATVQKGERKVTITVAVVCGGFFLCYIMSQMLFLLEIVGLIQMNFTALDVAQILGFANCAINPVIYVLMHDKLRAAFFGMFCCRK